MLVDKLQAAVKQAMRDKDAVCRDTLKLALSEVRSRQALGDVSEEEAEKLVRKIIESNRQSMAALRERDQPDDAAKVEQMAREIEILEEILPKQWSSDDVLAFLEQQGVTEQIKAAGADGQAIGLAMKSLKGAGAPVDGKAVGEVVRSIRQA